MQVKGLTSCCPPSYLSWNAGDLQRNKNIEFSNSYYLPTAFVVSPQLNFIFISIFRVDEMKRKKVLTCHATELSISNILHKRIASCLHSLEKIGIFPSQFPGIWRCPVLFLLEAFNKFLVESDCLTHVTLTMILSASATTQSVPFSH